MFHDTRRQIDHVITRLARQARALRIHDSRQRVRVAVAGFRRQLAAELGMPMVECLHDRQSAAVSGDGKSSAVKLTQGKLSLTLTGAPQYVTLRN